MDISLQMLRKVASTDPDREDPENATLGQQAYSALREKLLTGEWLPGAKLTLRGLAADLGTSVQPVREAVSRLSAEGALVLKPNASLMLPGVDKSIMDEIFDLRNILESEAARLATPRMSEENLSALAEHLRMSRAEHLTKSPRRNAVRADRRTRVTTVHAMAMLVAQCSGSKALAGQILQLRMRTAPYYAAAMNVDEASDREFVSFGIRLQEEFFRAVRRRDANEAAHIRFADLYTYQRFVYRRLGLD
ncbi:GntR family transcriptional regulator [Bradyrhizobium sp. USDA 4449]